MQQANNMPTQSFRKEILKLINPLAQPLPGQPSVAFVWPTELCSIGCAHCNYSSKRTGTKEQHLLSRYPEEIVQWLFDAGVKRFVACGGGEPLDEPEFIAQAIATCARLGLDFEIYTSGVSFSKPHLIGEYIKTWQQYWKDRKRPKQRFNIRLSLDAFHEELIGLEPLVKWIEAVDKYVPEWSVSVRSVRLEGDESVNRLAGALKGRLEKKNNVSGWIVLADGRKILIMWKGFVFEGRGQIKQLNRLGLKLYQEDATIVEPFLNKWNTKNELGRPLSLHHAVSFNRLDLEIHSNCEVHILQSQSTDLRLKFTDYTWREIKSQYYRDPLLHCTVENGLGGIATLLAEYKKSTFKESFSIPFSIEKIIDPYILSWITSKAILGNGDKFIYSQDAKNQAIAFLQSGYNNCKNVY